MSDCGWEKIDAFNSPAEFRRFVRWIESQRDQGICTEIPSVDKDDYADRLFVCNETKDVWILRQPDAGYFAGSWSPKA